MPRQLAELAGFVGICLLVSGVIFTIAYLRAPVAAKPRVWVAGLFAFAAILFWVSRPRPTEFPYVKIDQSLVLATFKSISIEGPRRQLVFHYALANTTDHTLRINASACANVSFRFVETNQTRPVLTRQPNPALSLLENNGKVYSGFTGLQRLPTTNPAMTMDQCPLELQPKQTQQVAIAIPYAYPQGKPNPSADDLKFYVRAFMPRIDGFGIADMPQNYEIIFPRAW